MDDNIKAFELTFEEREGYGYALVEGKNDNLAISRAYWTEIAGRLKAAGLRRVLIVEDIEEQSPMIDTYALVSELRSIGFLGIKVAFVDRYSSHQDINDFGVLVGENRGLYGKAFNDETEATVWLLDA